ncbi:bifunctional serine/threonine-protein kinase/formylglycine-generating enzyme family protein [Prochlorothrix hollandica]|uniref:bifunctional serine/threonine-protein kinase/formylglycine-generating enzyme family protein n=1 Tax=Prochlorothrix hollandica TaxID=1223 RepID=UPI003341BF5F
MAWAAGQRVNKGKYKILRVLGEGGFGITYLAEICQGDRQDEKIVIKTLRDEIQKRGDFGEFQQDFINEAIKLAKCTHPHVVKVGELFQETVPHPQQRGQTLSLQCMPLDYVEGEDLAVYLEKQPQQRLSEQEALIYIRQVGEALTVAHGKGLVHRDIKPDNILLRRNGVSGQQEAVLIDFGIAREFRQDVTQTHTQFYTPGFAPPEQYDLQAKRGAYTDIYALAATLYCMVTGRVPPEGSNRELSILKHGRDLLEPPQQYNGGLSSSLCDAILWGLQVETHQRPQHMEDWLRVLPGGSSVAPPPVSPPSPPAPKSLVAGLRSERHTFETVREIRSAFLWWGVTKEVRESRTVTRWLEDLGGGVSLPLVQIPAGDFLMGSPDSEVDRLDREGPQHRVNFPREFWMGQYEITQAEYQAMMGSNPATEFDRKFVDPNKPVINVSWDDAVEFCQRLSQRTGRNYRLPTEAEWEYACRAGTQTPFSFGETITPDLVNYNGNSPYGNAPKGEYRQQTIPVGQFPANSWGLYDMHGNVWEWCLDEWHEGYGAKPEALKQDGSIEWTQVKTNVLPDDREGTYRLLRGGSWSSSARVTRSAVRAWIQRDNRSYFNGFRVVLE